MLVVPENIRFTQVSTETEVGQILDLQARNLAANLTDDQLRSEGFVTVRHQPDVLLRMNRAYPSVIAIDGDRLAGYCLVMLPSFGQEVPELVSMFDMLMGLSWRGKPLHALRWFVMGQVCVAEGYRGCGVFDGLYQKLIQLCRNEFDVVITEVSERNERSLRAHRRVGFETVEIYRDPQSGEIWHVVGLPLENEPGAYSSSSK